MNTIIEAIRNATNGTFVGDSCMSTLMGTCKHYDEQGRCVTADLNYKESTIVINDKTYRLFRQSWYAVVIKPEYIDKTFGRYLSMYNFPEDYMVGGEVIDLRPDYVKEYDLKKIKERENIDIKKENIKTVDISSEIDNLISDNIIGKFKGIPVIIDETLKDGEVYYVRQRN